MKNKVMALSSFKVTIATNTFKFDVAEFKKGEQYDWEYTVTNGADTIYTINGVRFMEPKAVELFIDVMCATCKWNGNGCSKNVKYTKAYDRWEYKGAESKVENKNYMPELCKMFGLKWDNEKGLSQGFDVGVEGKWQFMKGTAYPKKMNTCDGSNIWSKTLLPQILTGALTIKPIVEFAKPIWCKNNGDVYKFVDANGSVHSAMFINSDYAYYRRAHGNMFKCTDDEKLPQAQIDQIVAEMKQEVANNGD